ncbi:MAG: hypothetical protein WCD36_14340 [Rhodanobacteraceae bacterium]
MQALAIASQQGQRIYAIDASNADTVIAQLNLPAPETQDIADAVNAGLTVTTSQSRISYGGQTIAEYISVDPHTGAAAYKIASGADGGLILLGIGIALLILLSSILVLASFAFASVIGIIIGIFGLAIGITSIITAYQNYDKSIFECFVVGLLGGFLAGIPAELAALDIIFDKIAFIVGIFSTSATPMMPSCKSS